MSRVIVVDDDPLACRILTRMLGPDHQVVAFGNGEEALAHFRQYGAEIVLSDLKMPRLGGMELLARVKEINPEVPVFIITGYSSLDGAVAAVKNGAYDYIAKPFDPDDVLVRINRALKERRLEETVALYRQERELEQERHVPLTGSRCMKEVLELGRRAARSDSSVLIQGETGVGKELVARMIHHCSLRRDQPFVPVNCGALAEGVLESELFGHERGAFTGAVTRRAGYFELANHGTLFLDEIGTTGNPFQVKLLRVLQDRTVTRVGSGTPIEIDTRILAATNQNLEEAIRRGTFRNDLYYRLSVVTLVIPPLRERPEDIPLLVEHFMRRYGQINPRVSGISEAGRRLLEGYDYPGNVRELENIIERAMILETSEQLTPQSLLVRGGTTAGSTEEEPLRMEEAERDHILRVLRSCRGRKLEAARLLGINKTTLWRKMKRYGLEGEQEGI
ncbi:MAG: sigma-54-dependent Fis family transcriptional regulator [Deltaproteobacteria bacterium]|jgi:DNA-binding NtrC family response regulator|uniref:sigma-54-dependent transcriptional regulator n=1 Tax=Hydrosulfovibrio ferrireducens TaxID=2934181 RepID=UPI001215BF89|nr:MAG: sigma-54-dependent Fis family transcriptional regulator [Deltaproteobacteria bacterium]